MNNPLFHQSPSAPALYSLRSAHNSVQAATIVYGEVRERAERIAAALRDNGFTSEERCAFVAQTDENTVLLLLGCLRAGVTAMPLSPRFPLSTREQLVQQAGARFVSDISALVSSNGVASSVNILPVPPLHHDATILCSSGSTGIPKMFLHTAEQHYRSALGAAANIPFGQGDCWLASLPLYHVGGYATLIRALAGGAALALPHYTSFDIRLLTDVLERLPVTHCSFVATHLYHALRFPPAVERLRNLKAILLGGSAIPESLIEQALERGLSIYTSYGSTEMASQITTTEAPEREQLRTSGSVLPHRELCISDTGEILVRGETLARGRITKQGIEPLTGNDSWYHSGDKGFLDKAGRLLVLGRLDNMFISGGENIHPEMIESALLERTDIVQAIVVPVPHPIYGSRPIAFLQREQNLPLEEAWILHLREYIAHRLPRFAIPDGIVAFPPDILASGFKPSRRALQTLAESLFSEAQFSEKN